MVDEWQVRDLVGDLRALFVELDQVKFTKASKSRDERLQRPAPGTQVPGREWAIHLDIDATLRLHEIACDVRNHVAPGRALPRDALPLCDMLAFHAEGVSRLDFADDVVGELAGLVKELREMVRPDEVPRRTGAREPRFDAVTIVFKARQLKVPLTRDTLRKWASGGGVSAIKGVDGKNRYLLTEVVAHYHKLHGSQG